MAGFDLGKQVGPLPMGAWIAVVGGGLAIAIYTRKNQQGQATTQVVTDTGADPGVGLGGSGWVTVQAPAAGNDSGPSISTNDEWARAATNYLIAQGYDPAVADSAIRKYMEANQLTTQEYAMLRIVLGKLGAPPTPLGPPADAPAMPTTPVVTPPPVVTPTTTALRYVTVTPWPTKRSTLWGISTEFYHNGSRYVDIYNANKAGYTRPDGTKGWMTNPNRTYPGRTLWVP